LNSNHLQTIFGKKFWLVCIAVGISLFGVVFALSRRADIQNCEQRLTGVMEFIKAQSADYTKYNDTAVAKSLVREAAAVHALEGLSLGCDEAALLEYARTLWLTGVSVLNAQGELVCEYTENGTGYAQLQSGIKMEPILSVIDYPQKTYVKRVELGGGNFVNVAVHSCADGTGVVLAYRYIPAEFSQKSVLSIQTLLDGYEISSTGTLLVAEDNRVAASNDPTLIGMNIFESERLMSIRRSGHADKLIRVYAPKGIEQCYGIYSHGRDYYLYAYVPARQVYTLTVMNLVITLVMYILILALVQVFRWNSAKDFFMQQEHSEQEYRKSLEQKNVALQLAVQRETKANLAKREFLFNMSHDIRTPMNAIIGFTALAQTHIDDRGQVEDYLKKISVSSQHLLSLINDVLDMSRIESGKVTLEAKPVHLPELVHELRDIVQAVVSEKDLSLTLDTVGVENEDVIADPLRLEQILINVLANAVKFTPDGGQISLWIVQKDTAPAGYADFEFHIKDNGIGMSEEFQKHIFEQFARERTSTVSKIQGTGLGMAITKSLVDMMGGRITVKSEQGKGSEFTISLRFPIGEAKTEQTPPAAKASASAGKKLLVVEDNELNLEIASTLLKEAGFEVDTAENGKIAVEKVEAASADRYDLILMDIQMPEMDGYEATRRIRALPDTKKAALPIVAMTANAFEDDRKNALRAGMNGHIAKPLDIQKLFQVLSELLK
jgi:signal transduction histidine kinase/CheY-like chemotaxis protein